MPRAQIQRMKANLLRILDLLPIIGLAAFGGFTRTLYGKARGEPYSWKIAIPEIIIAGFSGLIIHWATLEMGLSENLRTISIALAGYCARSVLAILNAVFVTFVKRNVEIKK